MTLSHLDPATCQVPVGTHLARIYAPNGDIAGTAVRLSRNRLLTCAHVVNIAIGRDEYSADPPSDLVRSISVDLPFVNRHERLGVNRLLSWSMSCPYEKVDYAVVELDAHDSDPPALPWSAAYQRGDPIQVYGFPAGHPMGVNAYARLGHRVADDGLQVERSEPNGFHIQPGFSGSPVWDVRLNAVIGIVVAADVNATIGAAFIIPSDSLTAAHIPLSTAPAAQHRLRVPDEPSSFIPRNAELQELREKLTSSRLVKLHGIDGIGKTRLALRLARSISDEKPKDFPDGACFVELSTIHSANRLATELLLALGSRPTPNQSEQDQLLAELKDRQLLIVLDDLNGILSDRSEHTQNTLRDFLAVLTGNQTRCRVLTTSSIDFPTPSSASAICKVPLFGAPAALLLFAERAWSAGMGVPLADPHTSPLARLPEALFADPDTESQISELIRPLQGLPMAIELIAAISGQHGLAAFDPHAPTTAAPGNGRNRVTMSALARIRHSLQLAYESLHDGDPSSPVHTIFALLSVFEGGFLEQHAIAILEHLGYDQPCVRIALDDLYAASLLFYLPEHAPLRAYSMHNLVREYALEQLRLTDGTLLQQAARLHAQYFLGQSSRHLSEEQARPRDLQDYRLELSNIDVARRWASKSSDPSDRLLSLDLSIESCGLLRRSGYWHRWCRRAERAVEDCLSVLGESPSIQLGRALHQHGWALHRLRDYDGARKMYTRALDVRRSLNESTLIAETLNNLCVLANDVGDSNAAVECATEYLTLAQTLSEKAMGLCNLALAELAHGDIEASRQHQLESLKLSTARCNLLGIARSLHNLAELDQKQSKHDDSLSRYWQSLKLFLELKDTRRGGAECVRQLATLFTIKGTLPERAQALTALAERLADEEDPNVAERLAKESQLLLEDLIPAPTQAAALCELGELYLRLGRADNASILFTYILSRLPSNSVPSHLKNRARNGLARIGEG